MFYNSDIIRTSIEFICGAELADSTAGSLPKENGVERLREIFTDEQLGEIASLLEMAANDGFASVEIAFTNHHPNRYYLHKSYIPDRPPA